jgi:hypothetical protein
VPHIKAGRAFVPDVPVPKLQIAGFRSAAQLVK